MIRVLQFESLNHASHNTAGTGFTDTFSRKIVLGTRPQHLKRAEKGDLPKGHVRVNAIAEIIQPTGTRTYVTTRIAGVPVTAELGAHDVHEQGAALDFDIDINRCVLIDPESDKVI
jgi:multiple sugar transport system ATP-binding protein